MKKLILMITVMTFLAFAPAEKQEWQVNTQESKLQWKAYKVTGSHEGNISLKSGNLQFEKTKLVGGSFIINMQSIEVTDLEGEYKSKLEGHLSSGDFFNVSKYNTSSIDFNKVSPQGKNSYLVNAKITIKGITKNIEFVLAVYGKKANASIKIDRTDFDIQYASSSFFDNLKDKAIYDEFDIIIDLEF